jgi:hypothetical protein
MTYTITEQKLADILERATEAGASKVLTELGLKKSQVSQREAYNRYGKPRVIRWRKNGKINPVKIGGILYYNVQKLEILASSNDLSSD